MFSDCPYGCNNGVLFEPVSKQYQPCPNCADKLDKISKGEEKTEDGRTIYEILRIPESYASVDYDFSVAVPDKDLIEIDSLSKLESLLEGVLSSVVLCRKPKFSCYINMGRNADILNFIFKYLKTSFKSGLTTAPLISATDIVALRSLAEGVDREDYRDVKSYLGVAYADIERADICVVTIDASTSTAGVYAVKGLLEGRERKGQSTLVFTNSPLSKSQKSSIISEYGKSMHLLTPFEVVYKPRSEYLDSVVSTSNSIESFADEQISFSGTKIEQVVGAEGPITITHEQLLTMSSGIGDSL